jgi:hypothetical protein
MPSIEKTCDHCPDQTPGPLVNKFPVGGRDAVYIAILAAVAAYFLIFPIWRAQFLLEIWPTEGWNAYYQDAASAGRNLYSDAGELIVNNYPPLSFYAIGYLGKLFGDNLFVGRTVSIIALFCVTIEIFCAVRILAGSVGGAAVGALWFIAFIAHSLTTYVGTNDPQFAGEAIMGLAFVWFLAREKAHKSVEPALLLMVVAGFWKHNMIAIPLASIVWLIIQDRRTAVRPILVSGATVCAGLLLCALIFGHNFIENLFTPRHYAWAHVLGKISHLQWAAVAFFICATWAWGNRETNAARYVALFIVISDLACILQWSGDNVFFNAEFEHIVALAVGIGLALSRNGSAPSNRFGADPVRGFLLIALISRLVISSRQESALVLTNPEFRTSFYTRQNNAIESSARIASIPGKVFCIDNKLLCRYAGKPFSADDFKIGQMIATGQATTSEISDLLKERHITVFMQGDGTDAGEIDPSMLRDF